MNDSAQPKPSAETTPDPDAASTPTQAPADTGESQAPEQEQEQKQEQEQADSSGIAGLASTLLGEAIDVVKHVVTSPGDEGEAKVEGEAKKKPADPAEQEAAQPGHATADASQATDPQAPAATEPPAATQAPAPPQAASEADDIESQVQRELDAAEGGMEQLLEKSLTDAAPPPPAPADAGPDAEGQPAAGKGKAKTPAEFHHQIVRGRISAVRGEDVFIDITGGLSTEGAKLQGVLPLAQFDRPPRMGSIMDFVVDKVNESEGLVYLSREGAISLATWDQLTRGSVVEARVTKSNKGGLELEMVGNIRAFMPASQIDLYHVDDLDQFVGQKLEAVVQEIDRKAKKVLLSRRTHLENQKLKNRDKLLKELEVGQERQGTVSSVVDFGAFVDLGGVDGLVHVTDLSHTHVKKPSDVVKAGDKVTVKVLKIEPEKNRIALGMKQVQPDPWDGIGEKYRAGEQISARVTRTANFGAFIEVEPGVEGLLPLSEISWKRIHKPEEVVNTGDVIQVAILNVDPNKKRLTLSLKAAKGDPWTGASHKYAKDSMVTGTVTGTTDFGAFVELEQGVEGLAHISELDNKRVDQVTDILKAGDTKEFRVKDVDEDNRKISLSLKPAGSEASGSGGGESQGDGRRGGRGGQGGQGGRGEQPIVKGPVRARPPKENLKSGLGNLNSTGLGGLSLDDFK